MEMQSIIMCSNYTFNLNCMVFNEVLNAFLYDMIDKRKNSVAISRKAFNVQKHDLICTGTGLKNMNINHKCVDIETLY